MDNMDNITPELIKLEHYNDKTLFKRDVLNNCHTFDMLIICNLYNIMNKLVWFIYHNSIYYDPEDNNMLFNINKKKQIFTLEIFNEKSNPNNYYNYYNNYYYQYHYLEDEPQESYCKKYVSCFILKDKLEAIKQYITYFNNNNEQEIQLTLVEENDDLLISNNEITYDNTLSFNKDEAIVTFKNINYIFTESIKELPSDLYEELKSKYIGVLIYENKLNTDTNIIEILHSINEVL